MPDVDDMWDDEEDAAMFALGHRDRMALGLARPSVLAAAPQPAPAPADERAITGKEVMPDANARPIQQPDTSPRLTAGAQDERAAMIEVIREARKEWYASQDGSNINDRLADALIAAGWTRGGRERHPQSKRPTAP